MYPNYPGLLAVALSLGIGILTLRWLRSKSSSQRWGWLLCFTVLSVPAWLCSIYYLHVLPERVWFYEFRSWNGSEFCVVFLGAMFGVLATWLAPRWHYYLWCTLICIGCMPYLKPFIAPLNPAELTERWRGEAQLQSTLSTCGPASVCNIFHFLGVSSQEAEIAQAAHTYGGGTEAWYLARYVRSRGLNAKFRFGRGFHPEYGLPAMIGVTPGHFIAVLEVTAGEIHYVDPLQGARTEPLAKFLDSTSPTGFHLVISR
jgi:hypothetical protein